MIRVDGPSVPPRRTGRFVARGNGLIFALLGLLISALSALGLLQNNRLQAKRDAGYGEATLLDDLRNATNNAIFESMGLIQNGVAFGKNGVTVEPVDVGGELVWQPTIAQLAGMGYLPVGWSTTTSTLNGAPYTIAFKRVPTGCVVAACNIEGHVVLEGPIRSGDEGSDGAVIGPILTRLGADSGVSLLTDATQITGFGRSWAMDNPVPGQPAGVVAVRVGTASSAFGQFVRIGDTRDPDLAGNLTVAGNTLFGNGATTSEFRSTLLVDAQPLLLRDDAGTACVTLRPTGVLDIACDGTLNAVDGSFKDSAGRVSTIGPGGVVTGGSVSAAGGFIAATATAFGAADPNAIVVKAGDLFVKDAGGATLLRVGANGDVGAGRDLLANGNLQARQITLTATVDEGDPCSGAQVAMIASGGLATCQGDRFRATSRYAGLGNACTTPGQQATDAASGDALVCRGGYYASIAGLLSSRVYVAGFDVRHGDFLPVATALPKGCPATASPVPPEATVYLLPQSDAETLGNPVLNRNVQWTGSGWTITMTDGAGAPTASTAVAEVFCLYP